jgi:gluconate 5-dehydrogenase
MNAFDLTGKTALVTGGGTGIGAGIGRCLAAAGARVVLAGRRQDVLDQAAEQLAGEAHTAHGPVQILVNNAGNHFREPAEQVGDDDFNALLDVHVAGAFTLTRELGRRMLERGDGSIVFIGSLNGFIGMPNVVGYSAAKAALNGMARALAVEWADRGVRVNVIASGWIDAGISKRAFAEDASRRERALARTPMHRFGEPEDIGWAAVYLCSTAARFVTGTTLHVDGGALVGF